MDKIFEITAKAVTIQVKDERTGVEYSRTLPIDYYENANVLRLSGEKDVYKRQTMPCSFP